MERRVLEFLLSFLHFAQFGLNLLFGGGQVTARRRHLHVRSRVLQLQMGISHLPTDKDSHLITQTNRQTVHRVPGTRSIGTRVKFCSRCDLESSKIADAVVRVPVGWRWNGCSWPAEFWPAAFWPAGLFWWRQRRASWKRRQLGPRRRDRCWRAIRACLFDFYSKNRFPQQKKVSE